MANDLPDYESRVTIGAGPNPGVSGVPLVAVPQLSSGPASTGAATALTGFGAELASVAQKINQGVQYTKASQALSGFLDDNDELKQKYLKDEDYATVNDRFRGEMEARKSARLQEIDDPQIRQRAELQMKRAEIESAGVVRTNAMSRQKDIVYSGLITSEANTVREAIAAPSDVARIAVIDGHGQRVNDAVSAGWIDHVTGVKLGAQFQEQFQTATLMDKIQRDPAGAVKLLNDPTQFQAINPSRRVSFLAAATEKDETNRLAMLQQAANWAEPRAVAMLGQVQSPTHAKSFFTEGMIPVESNGDNSAVSPKGALGASQILLGTAREQALKLGIADVAKLSDEELKSRLLSDGELNRRLGNSYFQDMVKRYSGRVDVAAAAYNAGPGSADKPRADAWYKEAVDKFGPQFTPAQFASIVTVKETRDYIGEVYARLGAPMDVGFSSPAAMVRASNTIGAVIDQNTAHEKSLYTLQAQTARATTKVGEMLQAGYDVDPKELAVFRSAQQAAADRGDMQAAGALRDLDFSLQVQPLIRQAWGMPPAQLDAAVQNMQSRLTAPGAAPTRDEQRLFDAFDHVRKEQIETLKSEPVALGGARGGRYYRVNYLDPRAALDDTFTQALRERDAQAVTAHSVYGGSGSPFLKQEAGAWAQRYSEATPSERAQILGIFSKGLSPQTFAAAMPQIVGGVTKDADRPALAMAAGLFPAAPDVAHGIIEGMGAAKTDERLTPGKGANKTAYLTDKDRYLPAAAFNVAARTDQAGPYAAMSDAIDARYAHLSAQANDVSGMPNRARLKQAADDVTGGVLTHNGGPVIAPSRGMTQRQFDGVLWSVTDADLAGAQTAGGKGVDAEFLRSGAKLVARSDGQYYLQVNRDDARPRYAVTPQGGPFVLDLRGRRPAAAVRYEPFDTGTPLLGAMNP